MPDDDYSNLVSAFTGKEKPKKAAKKRKSAAKELAQAQDLVPILESIAEIPDALKDITININMPESQQSQSTNQQQKPTQSPLPQHPNSVLRENSQKSSRDYTPLEILNLIARFGRKFENGQVGMSARQFMLKFPHVHKSTSGAKHKLLILTDPKMIIDETGSHPERISQARGTIETIKKGKYKSFPVMENERILICKIQKNRAYLFLIPRDKVEKIREFNTK